MFIVVDDCTMILRLTKRKLEVKFGKDVDVRFAVDGLEAIKMFYALLKSGEHSQIDAIIMDYHMPRCSGVQAINEIRNAEKEHNITNPVTIIGFSADVEEQTSRLLRESGADYVLPKPVDAGVLESLCTEILEKRTAAK